MLPEKIMKEDRKNLKLSFEYVLPDYEPTVKRVMLVDARLLPNERIELAESVSLSGVVEYRMVYQSVNDELSALSFTVPYECTLAPQQGATRIEERVVLSSFSCMPSGPRRVNAKGEVCASLASFGPSEMAHLREDADLHTLSANFPYTNFLYSAREEREYAEMVAELADPEACVLYSDGVLRIDEARPMKDGVLVGGKCLLSALVLEKHMPREIRAEIPFEEFLPMGQMLEENAHVLCEGEVHALSLDVEMQEDTCALVASLCVCFRASACENHEISLALDAYSTAHAVECEMGEQTLSVLRCGGPCRQTISMKLPASDGDPLPMARLIYAAPTLKILECTVGMDAVNLNVNLALSLLGTNAGEEQARRMDADGLDESTDSPGAAPVEFIRQKGAESFSLSLPMKGARPGMICRVSSPMVYGVTASLEEGSFLFGAELSLSIGVFEEIRVPVCVDVRRTQEVILPCEDSVCVVFPDSTDTLWSVAKAHHVGVEDILRENPEIQCSTEKWNDKDSLTKIQHLLIV